MKQQSSRKQTLKLALHHLWSRGLLFFAFLIVLLAISLIAVRASTPLLTSYQQQIQTWLSTRLNYPIKFKQLAAGWDRFEPVIKINDVTLENPQQQPLMHINQFVVGFDIFRTIIHRKLEVGLIEVNDTQLRVVSQSDGMTIYGDTQLPIITLKNNQQNHSKLLQRLFYINNIRLENIKIEWQKADNQKYLFDNVTFAMINNDNQHHAWGLADIKLPRQGEFAFVTNFKGDIAKKQTLKGNIYINGENLELRQWLPAFQYNNAVLNNGVFSGKIWGQIKEGNIASIQGIVAAKNLEVINLKTLKKQNIDKLSGNIEWTRSHTGWTLAANNIHVNLNEATDDFSANKLSFNLPFNLLAQYSEFNQQNKTAGKAPLIYKKLISNEYSPGSFFINYQPEKKDIITYIQFAPIANIANVADFLGYSKISALTSKYAISGNLKNIYINFSSIKNFAVSSSYDNLTMQLPNDEDEISGLNGKIFLFPTQGEIDFQSNGLQLKVKQLPIQNIKLSNNFLNKIYWYYEPGNLIVRSPELQLTNKDINIQGNLENISIPLADPAATQLNLKMRTDAFLMPDLKNYLPKPKTKHIHLINFLRTSFSTGTATATMQIDGQLNQFPFVNQKGIFKMNIGFNNIDLLYKKGWPPLTNLNGTVNFSNQQVLMKVNNGEIFGAPITNTIAEIPNIADNSKPNILVKGNVNTTLEHAMDYINHSPLEKTLGKHLAKLRFHGPAAIHLNMDFSLKKDDHHDIVRGSVTTQHATITLPSWHLAFNQVTGKLHFDNSVIKANNLTGMFLQQPMTAAIETLSPNTSKENMQINFASRFDTNYLKARVNNKFLNKIFGITNYTAQLQIFDHSTEPNVLSINSALNGITINLPEPFQKDPTLTQPLNVTAYFGNNNPIQIAAMLGTNSKFQGTIKQHQNRTELVSGNLHFGAGNASKQQLPGLLIDGSLASFQWQQWKSLLEDNSNKNENKLVRLINVNITELNFFNYLFLDTQVQVTHQDQSWNLNLNGPTIVGSVNVPVKAGDVLTMNLSRLYLNAPKVELLNKTFTPASLPPLKVNLADFHYNDFDFGKVSLLTQPMNEGIQINQVQINSANYNLNAAGLWLKKSDSQSAKLQGVLSAGNAKNLLAAFKYPNVINAENLQMKFDLQWPNSIFKPSLQNISGTVNLQTGAGVINDVGSSANSEITMGQLLTLFSLQSLQRRLSLNFNDLTKKGFSFETIHGDFDLNNGQAITHNTRIDGIIASINLNGKIAISSKEFNLFVEVTPKMTASLPVIAAIAGGPVVGVATWMVNKLVSSSVNQIASKYFHLGGSWSKPKITPLNSEPKQENNNDSFM